jgi:hypothetical protein
MQESVLKTVIWIQRSRRRELVSNYFSSTDKKGAVHAFLSAGGESRQRYCSDIFIHMDVRSLSIFLRVIEVFVKQFGLQRPQVVAHAKQQQEQFGAVFVVYKLLQIKFISSKD